MKRKIKLGTVQMKTKETKEMIEEIKILLDDILDDIDNTGCENCFVISGSVIEKVKIVALKLDRKF